MASWATGASSDPPRVPRRRPGRPGRVERLRPSRPPRILPRPDVLLRVKGDFIPPPDHLAGHITNPILIGQATNHDPPPPPHEAVYEAQHAIGASMASDSLGM